MSPNPLEMAKKAAGEYQKKHSLELANHTLLGDVRTKFEALLKNKTLQWIGKQDDMKFNGFEFNILHRQTDMHHPAIDESILLGTDDESDPEHARYYLDIKYHVEETKAVLEPKYSVIVSPDNIRILTESGLGYEWILVDPKEATFQEQITDIQSVLGRAKEGSPGMTIYVKV
jgi:hypothetical protein